MTVQGRTHLPTGDAQPCSDPPLARIRARVIPALNATTGYRPDGPRLRNPNSPHRHFSLPRLPFVMGLISCLAQGIIAVWQGTTAQFEGHRKGRVKSKMTTLHNGNKICHSRVKSNFVFFVNGKMDHRAVPCSDLCKPGSAL